MFSLFIIINERLLGNNGLHWLPKVANNVNRGLDHGGLLFDIVDFVVGRGIRSLSLICVRYGRKWCNYDVESRRKLG